MQMWGLFTDLCDCLYMNPDPTNRMAVRANKAKEGKSSERILASRILGAKRDGIYLALGRRRNGASIYGAEKGEERGASVGTSRGEVGEQTREREWSA